MSFDINTNVASLEAQNYLRVNEQFQGKTINEVTSGLRIVQSGDDAAGLAIANGYKANGAVLTQGISNANDGLSQLQIMDGGMNNITQLLDRASTLATQSATGTFTGDRSTLNDEFQSVLGEINRQAQTIGLNTGGAFAKSLQVFIGGGTGSGNIGAVQNGSETLNLSNSTVDAQSLGLTGVTAAGTAGTDIGPNSATSVSQILQNIANSGVQAGYSTFNFSGSGFSGANKIGVNVNLSGVTDANTLVNAINTAIGTAGAGSQYATAFKNAEITASLNTDANGKTQLTFSSGNSAFQVQAGDTISNALLGNFSSGSTGAPLTTTVTGAASVATPTLQDIVGAKLPATGSTTITTGTNDTLNLTVGGGVGTTASLVLTGGSYTATGLVSQINTQIAAGTLAGLVTAKLNSSNQIVLQAASASTSVAVNSVAQDAAGPLGTLGFTDGQTSSTTPALTTNDTITLQFQGGGLNAPVDLKLSSFTAGSTTMAQVLQGLNTQIAQSKQLAAAGITVQTSTQGNALVFKNAAGQRFDVGATGDSQNVLGLGTFLPDSNNDFAYTNLTGATYSATGPTTGTSSIGISINGGANQVITASLNGLASDATSAAAAGTGAALTDGTLGLSASSPDGLSVKIDGHQYDVDLSAVTTVSGLLSALNDTTTGLGLGGTATINSTGNLVITSNTKGTGSSVQILAATVGDSTAANLTALGLTASTNTGQNATEGNIIQQLNNAIATNTTLSQAGISASDSSGAIELSSSNATNFRIDAYGAAGDVGFGNSGSAFAGNKVSSALNASPYFDAQGARATSTLSFAPVVFGGDQQSLSFAAVDANGNTHTTSVSLNTSNAGSIDQALAYINSQLQATNDPTIQQVIAVKEDTGAGTLTGAVLPASTAITTGTNDKLDLTVGSANDTLVLSPTTGETASQLAANINSAISGSGTLAGQVTASVNSNNQLVFTATNSANNVVVNAPSSHDAAAALGFTDGQSSASQGTNGGIKFISDLNNFSVSLGQVGTTAGTEGLGSAAQQGTVLSGATVGTGTSADISNLASAQSAVTAVSNAVTILGKAQAVVGRGENQFNYAINLAQSQLTNFSSAEASIRDADMAAEAANLTKAQILMQAGVAALAQANSAPQQVLSLLKG